MKFAIAILIGVAACAVAASPADARGGCGVGFHRGPRGGCLENGTAAVVVAPQAEVVVGAPAVGVFVRGRGYWDGHRYWHHRDRWHGGWRYR